MLLLGIRLLVLYAGSLVVGLAAGNMITLPPILTREEFGAHACGTISGMVSAASQAGLAFGPALIGLIRDTRGSYQPALWVLAGLEVLAIGGVLWGPDAARAPRAATCGVIAAHRGAANHER